LTARRAQTLAVVVLPDAISGASGAMAPSISVTVPEGTPAAASVGQVPGHHTEMVHGDTTTLVHLLHRRTGIGLGPAESGREELDLFAFEAVHVGSGEEA
jgi:hypothetical protein